MLAVAGAIVLHETRGTTVWFDEWTWALERRGGGLETWLEPHNEHLSLVPVALYKLLFATAGLDDYTPYRLLLVAVELACAALLFAYSSRRIGPLAALAPTALLLFLGPAWQNLLWPFQIAWFISLAAGVGALLLLDREDRAGDRGAAALLALSLASSGLGVAIAAGLVVEVVWGRRRSARDALILALPLALYAAWWLSYRPAGLIRQNIALAPGFTADAAAGAIAALSGLAQAPIGGEGDALTWGRPLTVAAVAVLVWLLAGRRALTPRILGLLTTVLAFWVLTGLRRAELIRPDESRYLYVGALFVLLIAVELARGTPRLSRGAIALLAAAVLVVVVANIGDLREGGRFIRSQSAITRADLGALEIGRPLVGPDYVAARLPGYPFLMLKAGPYFAAARDLGSPAASPAELARLPEQARREADAELTAIHRVAPRPSAPDPPLGARPAVDAPVPAGLRESRSCVRLQRPGAGPVDAAPMLQLPVPPDGLLLTAGDGPVSVSVRRFATGFPVKPQAMIPSRSSTTLRIGRDRAPVAWHVRLAPSAAVTACALRPGP